MQRIPVHNFCTGGRPDSYSMPPIPLLLPLQFQLTLLLRHPYPVAVLEQVADSVTAGQDLAQPGKPAQKIDQIRFWLPAAVPAAVPIPTPAPATQRRKR